MLYERQKLHFSHNGETCKYHYDTGEKEKRSYRIAAECSNASKVAKERSKYRIGGYAPKRVGKMYGALVYATPLRFDFGSGICKNNTSTHTDTVAERADKGDGCDRKKVYSIHHFESERCFTYFESPLA